MLCKAFDLLFCVGIFLAAYPMIVNIKRVTTCYLPDLGVQFQVSPLVKQCEELIDHFKTNKKIFDSGN